MATCVDFGYGAPPLVIEFVLRAGIECQEDNDMNRREALSGFIGLVSAGFTSPVRAREAVPAQEVTAWMTTWLQRKTLCRVSPGNCPPGCSQNRT